jgi:hypothetical protein
MKTNVKNHFHRLRQALDLREKLLLRQIDVLLSQYKNRQLNQKIEIDSVDFLPIKEDELLGLIRSYGKFNVENFKISDLYENEDYIEANNDHELFYKSFQSEEELNMQDNKNATHSLKDKCNILNESIINMTLNESKELIEKSVDLVTNVSDKLKKDMKIAENPNKKKKQAIDNSSQGNKEIVEKSEKAVKSNENKQVAKTTTTKDEKGKSKLKRNEPTTSSTKKTLKNISNLTLNNCCSGIINLKNISHLTINTCKNVGKNIPKIPPKQEKEEEIVSPKCEFYQRLIHENKILKSHIMSNFGKNYRVLPGATCPGSGVLKKETPHEQGEIDEGTYSLHTSGSGDNSNSGMSSITDAEDGFQMNIKEEYNHLANQCSNQGLQTPEERNKSPFPDSNIRSPLPNSNLVFPFPNSPVTMPETSQNQESNEDNDKPHPIVKISLPESTNLEKSKVENQREIEEISNQKFYQNFMPSGPSQGFGICFMEFDPQPMAHPVQVQHWLKQIILETETEPNQTAEFLEFSDLN